MKQFYVLVDGVQYKFAGDEIKGEPGGAGTCRIMRGAETVASFQAIRVAGFWQGSALQHTTNTPYDSSMGAVAARGEN